MLILKVKSEFFENLDIVQLCYPSFCFILFLDSHLYVVFAFGVQDDHVALCSKFWFHFTHSAMSMLSASCKSILMLICLALFVG